MTVGPVCFVYKLHGTSSIEVIYLFHSGLIFSRPGQKKPHANEKIVEFYRWPCYYGRLRRPGRRASSSMSVLDGLSGHMEAHDSRAAVSFISWTSRPEMAPLAMLTKTPGIFIIH